MSLLSYYSEGKIEAGIDEAGRGCMAGPVVAAAVILPANYKHSLLNDSKKLTAQQRELLRQDIIRDAVDYYVAEVSHTIIDQINILNATMKAMHKAVKGLKKQQPNLLLIDGNRFKAYPGIQHECVIKGDGMYLSIAAASILAKTHRDRLMAKLAKEYPEYGWDVNAGYGTEKHRDAMEKFGLTPYHRTTFHLKPKQLNLF
ncbi:MAG: ribonuclease HII [Cytophaga sp.]|uniref:ribonuclease HII n=1 Tax=Cytophaga sp. TaxID=29535 RepID=UPI003F7D5736